MGNSPSLPFQQCIDRACAGRSNCVTYPNSPSYNASWVTPYNLDKPVVPLAVTRPLNVQDVAKFVTCASSHNVRVQAKSGGHSFENFGWGGFDGQLVVDLINFQSFSYDQDSELATIGSGMRLGALDDIMQNTTSRVIPHGTSPTVGIGGHATIGGLGPSSRMWGTCLDQIVEVEVVTADGQIQRASESENSDLFFALRGAGAGFGIITEFVAKTYPEPSNVVQSSYTATFNTSTQLASIFLEWQKIIVDPSLDWRFSSSLAIHSGGVAINNIFFGTEKEFNATGITERMPEGQTTTSLLNWREARKAFSEGSGLGGFEQGVSFKAKTLSFRQQDTFSYGSITQLGDYVLSANAGTEAWVIFFDLDGGATGKVPTNATSYAGRDILYYMAVYAIGTPEITETSKEFAKQVKETVRKAIPGITDNIYPGYVDSDLLHAQKKYWGTHLPRLETIKSQWDPNDLFHNPQSVRPVRN